MSVSTIKSRIFESIETKKNLLKDEDLISKVEELADQCIKTLKSGGKVIFCGNGGSFADAQHLSAEFTSRFLFDRPGLASIALGTNNSAITAIGNDYGYDSVFSREIEAVGKTGDVLIAITTSGNSKNVISALKAADGKRIFSAVFTGANSGSLPNETIKLHVPSVDTARIQECHILIGHIICELVEDAIFGDIE